METEGDYLRISEIRMMVGPVPTNQCFFAFRVNPCRRWLQGFFVSDDGT